MVLEINAFLLVLGMINVISYLFAVIVMGITFAKYKYTGHLWMMLGFLMMFVASVMRMTAQVSESMETGQLFTLWFLANAFLMLGIWGLLLALSLSQYDQLPKRAHFITLLVGLLGGLFASSNYVTLKSDSVGINAEYHPVVGVFSLVLLTIFILSVLRPMILKMRKNSSVLMQKHYLSLLLAYMMLVVWIVTVFFTGNATIRIVRPLLLGVAVLTWALSLYFNPLSLALTHTTVKKVIVTSTASLPLVSLDVHTRKEIDAILLTNLLEAMKTSLESLMGKTNALKTIFFQDSVLSFFSGKYVHMTLVLDGPMSSNLELLGRIYIDEFEKRHWKELETTKGGVVMQETFKPEINRILELLDLITV